MVGVRGFGVLSFSSGFGSRFKGVSAHSILVHEVHDMTQPGSLA